MNLISAIAVAILVSVNTSIGLLMMLRKVKLTKVTKPDPITPQDFAQLKGRPPKLKARGKIRHLYLPRISEAKLATCKRLLAKYQTPTGDRITLHLPAVEGKPERAVKIPFPVRWDAATKKEWSALLNGW